MDNSPQTKDTGEFSRCFEEFIKDRKVREGEDLTAKVAERSGDFFILQADGVLKSEARVPVEEFLTDDGELERAPGDEVGVDVELEMLDNGRGDTLLSRRNTRRKQAWKKIQEAFSGDDADRQAEGPRRGQDPFEQGGAPEPDQGFLAAAHPAAAPSGQDGPGRGGGTVLTHLGPGSRIAG